MKKAHSAKSNSSFQGGLAPALEQVIPAAFAALSNTCLKTSAFTRDGRIDCPAAKVELVDSVGAGDTIGAVIVEGLLKYGLDGLKTDVLRQVLERAAKAAGITCSRAGANPPWKEELDLAL